MKRIMSIILLFMICFSALSLTTYAEQSPTAQTIKSNIRGYYENSDKSGSVLAKISFEDKRITLEAIPNIGYEFVNWEFSNKFLIIDGTNTESKIVLSYTEKITEKDIENIYAVFTDNHGNLYSINLIENTENPLTSPVTSDLSLSVRYVALLVIIFVIIISGFSIARVSNLKP